MSVKLQVLITAILAAAAALTSACGGSAAAPDGPRSRAEAMGIPRTIRQGTIENEAPKDLRDSAERPLKPVELRALEIFFRMAELYEPEQLMSDGVGSELRLDGVVWVAYHDGLFRRTVGVSKQLRLPDAPRWTSGNYAKMDVLVEWARGQDGWRDP